MPKVTKILGNNKARACESLGFAHKKRLCQHFDTTSFYVNIAFLNGRKGVKEEKRLKDTDNVGKKEHLLLPLHQQIKQKR